MNNIDKYLFIPFKDKGRDFDGCDCRGLVGLVVKEEFGINIPDANVSCVEMSIVDEEIRSLNDWKKIDKPTIEQPCIILFKTLTGIINHMGIYVGHGEFLHTSNKMKHPAITSLLHPYWKNLIEGFYVPDTN